MDDQNNNSQDQNNSAVSDAQDSTVTEPQTAEVVEEVKDEETAANPFAALKEDESPKEVTEEKSADASETATESESAEGKEAETAARSEETNNDSPTASEPSVTSTPSDSSDSLAASDSLDSSDSSDSSEPSDASVASEVPANPKARWYVVHTFAGHENKVAASLKQRIEAESLENLIFDILVPTQDKIEIKGGKKETVKEKIFPGYILIKMELTDLSWLAVRTTQGVTAFIGAGNKPTPISEAEVASIVKFTTQGASPTFKDVFMIDDTVKIVDGPFAEFIGKVDSVDKEKGRVRVLVSIFGRETPVELDFLQVQKL